MVNSAQILRELFSNLNFYITDLIPYIILNRMRKAVNIISEHYNINIINNNWCLISFNYSKIKRVANLQYKGLGQLFLVLTRVTHLYFNIVQL
jgi:hypothetical protein